MYCAVGASGVEPGEEIIVSPYSMSASATAPLIYNAIPVFADIEEFTQQTKEINHLKNEIENILNDNKALEVKSINLKNKTTIADFMIVASGNSSRHIQALSEILLEKLKKIGIENCRLEGQNSNEWKLIDAKDIIIHIFHPEKRKFYDLEKMWSELIPKERLTI